MSDADDTPVPPALPLLDLLDLDAADPAAEPDLELELGANVVTATDARTGEAQGAVALETLARLAGAVLRDETVIGGRLDLHLVDSDVIADLNEEHLGGTGPTDVLSFPLEPDDDVAASERGPRLLGDVVLCPEVAAVQAPDHAGSLDAELALLVVHGVLHVLGHDHAEPDEAARMLERERAHLEPLGYSHPGPQT